MNFTQIFYNDTFAASRLWVEVYRICSERDYEKAHETVIRAADDVRTVLAMYKSAETGMWESTQ